MSVDNIMQNKNNMKEIESIINDIQGSYMILGDFNGHLGFLGPHQMNKNGELLYNLIDKHNLILLNGHPECTGEITWEQKNKRSVIDYILVNKNMHENFISMNIDDNKEEFDLSDHNLLTATFHRKTGHGNKRDGKQSNKITYMKITEDSKRKFLRTIHQNVTEDTTIEDYETLIINVRNQHLMKTMRNKMIRHDETQKIWFNKDIEDAIKRRKLYNRQRRNEQDTRKQEELNNLYMKQKKKVQSMVKIEITKHEKKLTKDIKQDKNNKKLWDVINTLRGKMKHDRKDEDLYDENNVKISEEKWGVNIENYWKDIYQKHTNNVNTYWNEEEKLTYLTSHTYEIEHGSIKVNNMIIPNILEEHFDAVAPINSMKPMEEPIITRNDVICQMMKIKEKKAPGPDGLKPELLKVLIEDNHCVEILTLGLNNILNKEEEIPKSWLQSKTVMVPKRKKPTVKQLRPIALTNASYKLFMGIVKNKIEEHMHEIRQQSELQAGFTKRRRIVDNLFILQYCIHESFNKKNPLFLVSIDFAKAFDSIKRDKLIELLMKYKIHPHIIDVIVQIYSKDVTNIFFNSIQQTQIEVSSGIRQGCNGSTSLFLLITYFIIEKIYNKLEGINTDICKIVALFFADDGLLLMKSLRETKESIAVITEIAKECGLNINKEKSNIMIYNYKETTEEFIEGISVTKKINYLGITIQNKKDCFKLQKFESLEKAKKNANIMPAVIAKSCNKLLIGKTYWKSAALPSILHGSEVIYYNEAEIKRLQIEENKAYRYIVNARKSTAISALRGEIGASLQITRDMKSKILFIRHLPKDNKLTKDIFMKQLYEKKPTKWIKLVKKYMDTLQLNINMIESYNVSKIKTIIKHHDDALWNTDLQNKSTLTLYREHKKKIHEEQQLYDNTAASITLFEARTGTLKLNTLKRPNDEDTTCNLCKHANENLEHFLLDCDALDTTRRNMPALQRPHNENKNLIMANFLLFNEDNEDTIERNKNDLQKLWQQRFALIQQL